MSLFIEDIIDCVKNSMEYKNKDLELMRVAGLQVTIYVIQYNYPIYNNRIQLYNI